MGGIQGVGFRVQGSGFRAQGIGFRGKGYRIANSLGFKGIRLRSCARQTLRAL
jgi:acylphosphatase